MKIKTILLGAALAATVPMMAAQSHFVMFDSLLRVPALCYPLPPGWTGMGWIKWNVPARSNPYLQSTILMNPSERRIVQEAGMLSSEMIREVKTVDNPLSPGDKIERPIYFNHSLINSRQDTLIMSDRTIEPHEAEKLMGQGFWTAVD